MSQSTSLDLPARIAGLTHLGAGWILWLLIALSVVAVAVIFERLYVLVLAHGDADACRADVAALLRRGNLAEARARAQESPSLEGRVIVAGFGDTLAGAVATGERLAGARELARLELERRLTFLGTLGNNAPFIGLLGTVIGIIRAFQSLDGGGGVGKVGAGLMTEVGTALVATAIGILVALPAIAAYNVFQRLVKTRLTRIDALGRELVAALSGDRS